MHDEFNDVIKKMTRKFSPLNLGELAIPKKRITP
jgi:hypothetical protein